MITTAAAIAALKHIIILHSQFSILNFLNSQFYQAVAHATVGLEGRLLVLHQYLVALLSPQGRQETEVVAQLATRMRRREITEIGSQRNVVFRIENM